MFNGGRQKLPRNCDRDFFSDYSTSVASISFMQEIYRLNSDTVAGYFELLLTALEIWQV